MRQKRGLIEEIQGTGSGRFEIGASCRYLSRLRLVLLDAPQSRACSLLPDWNETRLEVLDGLASGRRQAEVAGRVRRGRFGPGSIMDVAGDEVGRDGAFDQAVEEAPQPAD